MRYCETHVPIAPHLGATLLTITSLHVRFGNNTLHAHAMSISKHTQFCGAFSEMSHDNHAVLQTPVTGAWQAARGP